MRKFWMLYMEGCGSPTHKHSTKKEAVAEAERLTRTHGLAVHVLESVATASKCDVQWKPHDCEFEEDPNGIPF